MNSCPQLTAEVATEFPREAASRRVRLHCLLVPLDFSPASFRAYHYARALTICRRGMKPWAGMR